MSRGNWESHKLLFGEDTTLKPCPFCGAEPYVDSCDRIIDIGCDKCGYHRHFRGLVQDEIETDVVVSRYKDSKKAYEWYDKDAYQKAAAGWNERQNRLDEICENYGLTPEGVEFALSQYQKIICEITHGMLSKLTYEADRVLEVAQERWCNTCELKEAQEPVKPEIGKSYGICWYICPECRFPIAYKDVFCRYCGRRRNGMTDRDKVLKGLRCLSNPFDEERDCDNCSYDFCSCVLDVTADALELLKKQEPHLLTIEDFVRADHYGYLAAWTEERNGSQFWKLITIRALECDKKRMRYWSSRPTNEQRETVKWE